MSCLLLGEPHEHLPIKKIGLCGRLVARSGTFHERQTGPSPPSLAAESYSELVVLVGSVAIAPKGAEKTASGILWDSRVIPRIST